MKISPVHDHILVKVLETESRSTGGIYIADSATNAFVKGKVISTGPGRFVDAQGATLPCCARPGETVLFRKGASIEVSPADKTALIRDEHVLAVLDV